MRALITALIVLLWLLLGWYYKTTSDSCCSTANTQTTETANSATSQEATTKVIPPAAKALGPLTFDWSTPATKTNEGWKDFKNNLLRSLNEEDRLLITGAYRATETNNTEFENLGLARAAEARKLFPDIADDRIELKGQLVDDQVSSGDMDFESATFRTLKTNKSIKETSDRTLIYFPYNSTNKLNSSDVEDYLNDVADRVKASGERIRLTGHTDSTSSAEYNMRLGQRRASIIKNYLVSRGVDPSKIITQSKGEEAPIASNNTKEGKSKNRRTELEIIK